MDKVTFIKVYDAYQTASNISYQGLSDVQRSLVSDTCNQLYNLLTDNGQESLYSAADKLGLELI